MSSSTHFKLYKILVKQLVKCGNEIWRWDDRTKRWTNAVGMRTCKPLANIV